MKGKSLAERGSRSSDRHCRSGQPRREAESEVTTDRARWLHRPPGHPAGGHPFPLRQTQTSPQHRPAGAPLVLYKARQHPSDTARVVCAPEARLVIGGIIDASLLVPRRIALRTDFDVPTGEARSIVKKFLPQRFQRPDAAVFARQAFRRRKSASTRRAG